MPHNITFVDTLLHYEQPLVVTARDSAGGAFVGLSYGEEDADGLQHFALVQVDRPTMSEFVRGELDLLTLLTERQAGLLLLANAYGAPGETAVAALAEVLPPAALPESGMFMPAQPSSIIATADA
jgi:hypothetical protein